MTKNPPVLDAGPIITAIIPPGGEQSEDEKLDGVVAVSGEWTLESWLASKGTVLTVPQAHAATALVPRYNIVSREWTLESWLAS